NIWRRRSSRRSRRNSFASPAEVSLSWRQEAGYALESRAAIVQAFRDYARFDRGRRHFRACARSYVNRSHNPTGAKAQLARGQSPVLVAEFVNPNPPYHTSHASTIAQTTAGDLVAAWFGGSAEGHTDVSIWFARKTNGRWNPAVEVANGVQPDGKRFEAWNPVLFQQPRGPLFLFYKVGPADGWWGMVISSTDDGRTWSEPRRLPDGVLGP